MAHEHMLCSELAAHQNNNNIYLDLGFQSEERWSDKQRQNFMKSVFRNFVPSPIVLAHVESCMNYCATTYGEDSYQYSYFYLLHMKGYKFISIDGNNRTKTISRFFNNEFPLSQVEHVIMVSWAPKK